MYVYGLDHRLLFMLKSVAKLRNCYVESYNVVASVPVSTLEVSVHVLIFCDYNFLCVLCPFYCTEVCTVDYFSV